MNKYAFIGDVHACYEELVTLLQKITDDRTIIFLGDAFDRGPYGLKTIDLIYDMIFVKKNAKYVRGNHCNKFYRYAKGNPVKMVGGIVTLVEELNQLDNNKRQEYLDKFIKIYENSTTYLLLERGSLVAVHGGWKREIMFSTNQKENDDICIYNKVNNIKGPDGFPLEWIENYDGGQTIIRGHIVYSDEPYIVNNIYSIDTGCVHGGNLTALLWPEKTFIQEKAKECYHGDKQKT